MRGGIGATLTRNDEQFIAADYRHVTLRSLDDDFMRVVDAEELARLTNVTWHTERAGGALLAEFRGRCSIVDDDERLKWWTNRLGDGAVRVVNGAQHARCAASIIGSMAARQKCPPWRRTVWSTDGGR